MTPRERVMAALRHEEPDRIPLDLGGTESSGMTAMAYNAFREQIGLPPGHTRIVDTYQQIVKIEDDVRERLEVDTVPLFYEAREWKPAELPDGSPCEIPGGWNPALDESGDLVVRDDAGGVVARMPAGGFYFEPVNPPLAGVTEVPGLDDHADAIGGFDVPSWSDESLDEIGARARSLFEETDYCIVANFMCHLLAAGQILRGFENFMVDLMVNRELAHALLERLTDAYCRRADEYLGKVGPYVQVVLVNDDLGTQAGPMLSPECYREMILPYQRRLFGHVKGLSDAPLLLHSCGSVRAFIPDLIDTGVDALNPIQVSAAGMDSAGLERDFGGRLAFWGGGCDTQRVLNKGTPAEIDEEVKRRMGDLSPGGGFVFCQVHNVQPDVPPENVEAMFEAFRRYR